MEISRGYLPPLCHFEMGRDHFPSQSSQQAPNCLRLKSLVVKVYQQWKSEEGVNRLEMENVAPVFFCALA